MEIMAKSFSNDVRSSNEVVSLAFTSKNSMESISSRTSSSPADNNTKIPSMYVDTSTQSCENGISTIDSALLCAMRDPRERHALLRLEQTMIDFMKEETTGYIEVGGPNNSIVISPTGNIGKNEATCLTGRPTSFQRCYLHRLADRFGIDRATNDNGMIRLIKIKGESSIPSLLLIDLEPSEYAEENVHVRGIATKLSDTSIGNKAKHQKMKIMKRSSSGLGSSSSLKSDGGKGNSSRNRKNRTDKEKAYAEARARIFNESGTSEHNASPEAAGDVTQFVPSNVGRTGSTSSLSPESIPSASPPPSEQAEAEERAAAINKATYRNRREEENDPDFQRLSGHATYPQQQYGYNPHHQQFYPSTQPYVVTQPYATSQQYASHSVEGEMFHASPTYYHGQTVPSLFQQNSSADDYEADVNNLEEFPSLGASTR